MLSMPVLDAASSSSRSTKRPASMSLHAAQTPQGVAVTPVRQLRLLARMRAIVVLPTPRVPVSRYAWWMRPRDSELASAVTTCSWPESSPNVIGRHLRASTW